MLTMNHPLCVQIECLGFLWILINIIENVFYKSENIEKDGIIHDMLDTLLQKKQNTQIGVIPHSPR